MYSYRSSTKFGLSKELFRTAGSLRQRDRHMSWMTSAVAVAVRARKGTLGKALRKLLNFLH